jgi:hypothetical protein
MDISIVMGTYNRLPILKRCIAAVRRSCTGMEYEIIVVDGGSTDGTLEWLESQERVICIRQGRLLGATRAYNAGFRLARAPYVCHINDDDLVHEDCIRKGLWYIQDRPDVGQVAFAFDLWNPDYGFDGVFGITYANKGITRRELGDRAQWWDERYYTYAADTELSCRITEMGYRVVPLHECKAHDLKTQDELREINNPGGHNTQDSPLFYSTRQGIESPLHTNRRVLHFALNTPKDNQPALERALRSMGPYKQIDRRLYSIEEGARLLQKECDEWDPALVFMQLQTSHALKPEQVEKIKAPGRTVVNWSGDVQAHLPSWYAELGADLTLLTNETWVEQLKAQGINADYLQIGFNQEIFHPWGRKRENTEPIIFLGSDYGLFPLSQERRGMAEFLRKRYGKLFGCYGIGWRFTSEWLSWHDEAAAYRACKIAIGHSQVELERYTSDRLFRAMGSGAFYLTKWYPAVYQDYVDGVHLDWWYDLEELWGKIEFWLENERERQEIAHAGSELAHHDHTWLDRAYELTRLIGWHQWR